MAGTAKPELDLTRSRRSRRLLIRSGDESRTRLQRVRLMVLLSAASWGINGGRRAHDARRSFTRGGRQAALLDEAGFLAGFVGQQGQIDALRSGGIDAGIRLT